MNQWTQSHNPRLELAAGYVRFTGRHIFLTGRAGTGKTTFLRNLKNITWKRHIIVAPTGVAAINAGGVTIHSFFQLPFGPQVPEELALRMPVTGNGAKQAAARLQRFTREKINIIKSIDLLVIDEISMVRADLLDAIDAVLRRFRKKNIPFGGVQLLMIGDLQQLAPIAKDDEWKLLRDYYDSVYFFSSKALQNTDYVCIELIEVYRQRDEEFIRLLGKVRDNKLDQEALNALEKRLKPNFVPGDDEDYITLTTHNYQAQDINEYKLQALKGKPYTFHAVIEGDFPEFNYPTGETLKLKTGAQVMFVKNDPTPLKQFYNGKIGRLVRVDDEVLYVKCPDSENPVAVTPLQWHNCRYTLDESTKEISETIIGTFEQYPLKLAWAVTIHKSQGLTFDKVIIDARQAFAYGQVYVALSRCRTLEGIVLSTSITSQALKNDLTVSRYVNKIEENIPDKKQLEEAKNAYGRSLVEELFDFSIYGRRISYLQKLLSDNASAFDPEIAVKLARTELALTSEIITIAEKFKIQVQQYLQQNPDIENNDTLQDRIKKACEYFVPRFENLMIKSFPGIGSDNKAVLKTVNDLLERFGSERHVKLSCLRGCANGFTLSRYLEIRAKSAIEEKGSNKGMQAEEITPEMTAHPELYTRLRQWRDRTANKRDVTHYRILPRKAMREIADRLPLSRKELLNITGMGQKKINEFGEKILEIISTYLKEKNIDKTIDHSVMVQEAKEKKPDSRRVSYELFSQGKTISEIAAERNLATSTIEGHLAHYVGTGEIEVEKVLSARKLSNILSVFKKLKEFTLSEAKSTLGEEVSWTELRFAIKHIEFQKSIKTDKEIRKIAM